MIKVKEEHLALEPTPCEARCQPTLARCEKFYEKTVERLSTSFGVSSDKRNLSFTSRGARLNAGQVSCSRPKNLLRMPVGTCTRAGQASPSPRLPRSKICNASRRTSCLVGVRPDSGSSIPFVNLLVQSAEHRAPAHRRIRLPYVKEGRVRLSPPRPSAKRFKRHLARLFKRHLARPAGCRSVLEFPARGFRVSGSCA